MRIQIKEEGWFWFGTFDSALHWNRWSSKKNKGGIIFVLTGSSHLRWKQKKKWVNSDFQLEVSPVYTSCLSSPLLDPPRLGLYILASPDQAITLVWAWFQTVPECSACIQVQLCLYTSPAYHTWVYILNRPGQAIIEFGDWVCKCIWIVYTDVVNETVLTKLSMSSVIGCSNTSNHLLASTP